jgi:hypothetical protein
MPIIDLTDSYRVGFIQNHDRLAYENSFPELFEHYYRFWTSDKYNLAIISDSEIDVRKKWILEHIERLGRTLNGRGVEYGLINYVFFIGVGTTNGHAFKRDDRLHVWLPLETYTSENLVRVFVTHEIVHALHYHNSPSFYFESHEEKNRLSRLLITEGLATYMTRELLGISDIEAMWADFLDKTTAKEWWEACRREEPRLFQIICDNYSRSDTRPELFQANDKRDIYKFRAGYYAGLQLFDRFCKSRRLLFPELLDIQRDKLENEILSWILNSLSRCSSP